MDHSLRWGVSLAVALAWAGRSGAAPLPVTAATAGSQYAAAQGPTNAVDGVGWNPVTDTYDSVDWQQGYLSAASPTLANRWLQVSFGTSRTVRSLKFWNWNQSGTSGRSLWTATLAYSSNSGATWTDIGSYDFRPGWGASGYTPDIWTFGPVTATDMKLHSWSNYISSEAYFGVAELQFFSEALTNNFTKILPQGILTRVVATASDRWGGSPMADAMRMVDGTGLTSGIASNSLHANGWNGTHWLNNGLDAAHTWAKFDLGAVYALTRLRVWNYNEATGTRGITSMDIYTSQTGTGNPVADPGSWTLFRSGQTLALASGSAPVGGQDVPLSIPAGTRYVAFANMVNGGDGLRGLSEVQFYGAEPQSPSRGVTVLMR